MKRYMKKIIPGILLLATLGFGYTFMGPVQADACGWDVPEAKIMFLSGGVHPDR